MTYWQAIRQFNRSILLYLVYFGAVAFAYFGVQGVVLNLYLLRSGYGPDFIGVLLGSGQIIWAVFAFPAGAIGTRFGVKRAMVLGMVILAVSMLFMLAVELLPPPVRPAGLMITWMLSWVGAALGAVNGAPYLMAVTSEQNRSYAFAAQQTVMAAAGFLGSLIAGILPGLIASMMSVSLDSPAPYRFALLLAPAAYIIGFAAFSRAGHAEASVHSQVEKVKSQIPLGFFIFLGVVITFQALSEGTVRTFFNVYLDQELSLLPGMIGLIIGSSQLALILISLVTPLLLSRIGTHKSIMLTSLGLSLFNVLLAWLSTGFGAAFAFMGFTGMLTMMATARGMFSQEAVSERWRTTTSAIATIGMATGWATASWLSGAWINTIGFGGLFLSGAGFALVSFILMAAYLRRFNVTSKLQDAYQPGEVRLAEAEAEELKL